MTREDAKRIVSIIAKAFPRFTIVEDKEGMDIWAECLADIEYEDARKCVIDSIKCAEFPPTIAEIRKRHDELMAERKRTAGDILRYYEMTRTYYPGSGEPGYGKAEFLERAKTPEQAARLYATIVKYVNSCTDWVMDFAECIRTVK